VVKVLPHVMRNINEFNIPAGNTSGYEILYFGVNLILMFDYRLYFDVEVIKNSNSGGEIEVLIIRRKDVRAWKSNSSSNQDINLHYRKRGERINDIFKPSVSDAYAFILSNRFSRINNDDNNYKTKTVEVTLIHTWQQEIKESQLKSR
jgi:hypothetical protein